MDDYGYSKINVDPSTFDNGDLKFGDFFSIPPMFFTKNYAEVPLINMYENGTAFIISSGPSFAKIDQNKLRQPGILTLGINNSSKSFRPNLWTCVDSPSSFLQSVWMDPTIRKIVPISHIEKTLTDSHSNPDKFVPTKIRVGDCPNVVYYRRNEVVNTEQYLFEDTLNWGNHSDVGGGRSVFMAAVRIMYLLGIRKLFLLGVDFKMGKDYHYHFEQHRHTGSVNGNNSTYKSMMKWFGELQNQFLDLGFEVYNCNPDSALTVFPYKPFDKAIDIALKGFPSVTQERTDGMYTQKKDAEDKSKLAKAQKEAKKYTDKQREDIKVKLQEHSKLLDEAKENTENAMAAVIANMADEDIEYFRKTTSCPKKWANNLSGKFKDDKYKNLINVKKQEIKVRKDMRDCKDEKKKMWGEI